MRPSRSTRRLLALLACGLPACAGLHAERRHPAPELPRFEFARAAMGTEFRVLVHAADEAHAAAAAEAAFARIQELDRRLTDYDPGSELARLGARSDAQAPTAPVALSDELYTVLDAAQEMARASQGAFDVTVGPFVRLWRRARRRAELPGAADLAAARRAVGHEKLVLDPVARSARLLAPGMRLDLGGIAKGYALDRALEVLAAHGLTRALVVGGGEMRAGDPPPGRAGWSVALVDFEGRPGATLELARAALATSGDLEQYLELGGTRYSHILDPRTGQALTERRLVSVLAPTATESDALATALSVLGPAQGLALAARARGVEARVLVRRAGEVDVFRTPGFPRLSCAGAPALPDRVDPGP